MPRGALVLLPVLGLLRVPLDEDACASLAGEAVQAKLGDKEVAKRAVADLSLSSGAAEFYAEALGLAQEKADFAAVDFCKSVHHALECSTLMDKVLTSTPVMDLAYGECVRSGESAEYCGRFQTTIQAADVETDLDTLRACYLLKEVKGPGAIVEGQNKTDKFGAEEPAGTIVGNTTVATPFGVHTEDSAVPAEPPRITVEPLHTVRKNGSAYEEHHIVAGDGKLQEAGSGKPAAKDLPFVPPPTLHEVATTAAAEGGRAAGAAVGSALGHQAGGHAGEKAGLKVGAKIAEATNSSKPHEEVEATAYKAGFEAGQKAGKEVLGESVAALLNLSSHVVVNASAPAANWTNGSHHVASKPVAVAAGQTAPRSTEVLNSTKPTLVVVKAIKHEEEAKPKEEYSGFLSKFVSD